MHANFLATPDRTAVLWRHSDHTVADALAFLESRATVEISAAEPAPFGRVASITLSRDGALDVTYGTWQRNPFNADLLSFAVSAAQPSARYRSNAGAARSVERWLR